MPCSPGLSPQSVWMVCSAPEMTTVSKPKRNPASADVSDQKKMRLFISGRIGDRPLLTNSRAISPAIFRALHSDSLNRRDPATGSKSASTLGQRISFFSPLANSAVHRDDVLISHLLQIVSRQAPNEIHLRNKAQSLHLDLAHAPQCRAQ